MTESADPDFDVVIVGAGIAGSVTAALLARDGHSVALIERGEAPGSKNLSGGGLYGHVLDSILPNWASEAPVEIVVTRNVVTFLTQSGAVSVVADDPALASPVNAVIVLRAAFDSWLAERAESEGALLMSGVRVHRLLAETGKDGATRVVGVEAAGEELRAGVVVAADGVNSFLAQGVGLRARPDPTQRAVGINAVVRLGVAIAAAAAVHKALDEGDMSAKALARYRALLADSSVGRDLCTIANAPAFFARPRVFSDYGPLLAGILHRVYDVDTKPRNHLLKTVRQVPKDSPVELIDLIGDGLAAVRAL